MWIKINGRNKRSNILIGVFYRSEKMLSFKDWLDNFEETIAYVKSVWDGPILLTGDFNINLMIESPDKNSYIDC